jgi:hypothetical protein
MLTQQIVSSSRSQLGEIVLPAFVQFLLLCSANGEHVGRCAMFICLFSFLHAWHLCLCTSRARGRAASPFATFASLVAESRREACHVTSRACLGLWVMGAEPRPPTLFTLQQP